MAEQPSATMRPYIVSIESNVKGTPFKLDLGPKTLIIGPSRSGKTGITNAIELALTGSASDVRGREDVAEAGMLMALAPGRQGTLFAEVTLSDGAKARWETSGAGKGSAKTPKHQVPPGIDQAKVLPLRPVKKVIVASADSARRSLLAWIAGGVTHADVEALIPAPLLARYKSLLVAAASTDTPIDRLLHATEQAKREAREAGVRAKTAEKITAAAGTSEAPPADEDFTAAEKAVTDAAAHLEEVVREDQRVTNAKRMQMGLDGTRQELNKLDADIAKQQDEAARLAAEMDQRKAEVESLAGSATPLGPTQKALLTILGTQAGGAFGDQCIVCLHEPGVGQFQQRYNLVNGQAQARLAAAEKLAEAERALTAADADYAAANGKLATLKASRQQVANTLSTFEGMAGGVAAPKFDHAEVERAREALNAANLALQNLVARRTNWQATKRSIDAASGEQQVKVEWKQLEEACDKAVEMLLDRHVASVEAKVQARLPPSMKFGMQLRDGVRGVFELGFRGADGLLNSAVSGGEWSLMTAAMADAFAPAAGPSVVIPFDRQMDPGTLSEALAAWAKCESQVIVASVVEPAKVPNGWTVIRLGEETKMVDEKKPESGPVAALVEDQKIAAAEQAPAPEKKAKKPAKPRKKKGESDEDYAKRLAEQMTAVAEASTKSPLVPVAAQKYLCADCGEELTPENSSKLDDGKRVVHIGCKAAEKAALLAGPTQVAAGGKVKIYDVVAKEPVPAPDDFETTGVGPANPNLPTV